MQRVLETNLSRPVTGVIQYLEAARKEMAPKIIICKVADDKSWFVCQIEYGYSYAIVTGQAIKNGKATCVSVDIYNSAALSIVTIGLLTYSIFSFVYHPQVNNAWGLIGGVWLTVLIVALLWLALSRYILTRFVKDIFKGDSGIADNCQ